MMKTVRNTFHTIGDHGSDAVRAIGAGTADLAMRIGSGTAGVAKRIGPRRALIGLAIIGVAIGGSVVLVRYLRARSADSESDSDAGNPSSARGGKSRKNARGDRSNAVASQ